MKPITASIHINAPAEHVFAVFGDLRNTPALVRGIKRCEVLTDGPIGQGTRFRETRVMFGREATEEMEITAWNPPREYTVGCQSCGCVYSTQIRFTPEKNGTRVEFEMRARAVSLLAKLMSPMMRIMAKTIRKCLTEDLEDLRRAAEAGSPAAVTA